MTSYRLGINTCFAVKRWPRPERWARLVHDDLGLDLVQHTLDLVDLDTSPAQVMGQADWLRAACAAGGLTLHSTFTGLAAYSSNLLLHPDLAARERALAWYRRVIDFTAAVGEYLRTGKPHLNRWEVAKAGFSALIAAQQSIYEGKRIAFPQTFTDEQWQELRDRLRVIGPVT